MTSVSRTIAASFGGLLLGWGTSAWFKGDSGRNDATVSKKERPLKVRERGERSRISSRTDLPDVQACRDLLAAAETEDGRHPLLRRFDRQRALRRWIELDPQGAMAEAERSPSSAFARDLLETWTAHDPHAALAAFRSAGRDLVGEHATVFFTALMRGDPALAAAELEDLRWQNEKVDFLGWNFHHQVFGEWMRQDPAAAIAWLGSPGGTLALSKSRALAAEWARVDFKAAWDHCFPGGIDRDSTSPSDVATLLARGLLEGSEDALGIAGRLPIVEDENLRDFAFRYHSSVARLMVEDDPQRALDVARSLPGDDPLRREILAIAGSSLASGDPLRALELLEESGGSSVWITENESLLRESFAALAGDDPGQAAARIADLPEGRREDAMIGMLTRVFASDFDAALEQCRAWLADPELQAYVPEAWAKAFSWSHGAGVRDPGEALAALPELNGAVDAYVLSTWSKADPEAAAGWIAERLEQGEKVPLKGRYVEQGIFSELATARPEFTAAWLLGLPEGEVRTKAADTLVANWAAFDPAAAGAWIESLPAGSLREAAERGLGRVSGDAREGADPFR